MASAESTGEQESCVSGFPYMRHCPVLELAVYRSIHLRDVDRTGAEASCGRLVSDLSMQDFLSKHLALSSDVPWWMLHSRLMFTCASRLYCAAHLKYARSTYPGALDFQLCIVSQRFSAHQATSPMATQPSDGYDYSGNNSICSKLYEI